MKNGPIKLTPMFKDAAPKGADPNSEIFDGDNVMVIDGPVAMALGEAFARIKDLSEAFNVLSLVVLDQEARLEKLGAPANETLTIPQSVKNIMAKAKANASEKSN